MFEKEELAENFTGFIYFYAVAYFFFYSGCIYKNFVKSVGLIIRHDVSFLCYVFKK